MTEWNLTVPVRLTSAELAYLELTANSSHTSISDRISDLLTTAIACEEQQDAEQAAHQSFNLSDLPPIVGTNDVSMTIPAP